MGKDLTWRVGDGKNVMVGIYPILGLGENFQLSPYILDYLEEIGYFTLAHIRRPKWLNKDISYWCIAKDLGIVGDLVKEWEDYTN